MARAGAAVARPETKGVGMLTSNSAMMFVLLVGTSSFFADMTYEGGRSIVGQFLQLLGSSAAAVGIAAGAGEFLGYALRFVTGYFADKTGAYWRITIVGYVVQLFALPTLAFVGFWQLAVAIWFVRVQIGWAYGPGMALVLFGLNVALLVPLVWWLDRGRLVSGSMPLETT